nr:MAG TPA: hypothetical protein [Caudoviricetes sp.]
MAYFVNGFLCILYTFGGYKRVFFTSKNRTKYKKLLTFSTFGCIIVS